MVWSTSSMRGAAAVHVLEVSRVMMRSGWLSFSARIAGDVIRTSPRESSRTQRMFFARSQVPLLVMGFGAAPPLCVAVCRDLVYKDIPDLLDHAGGRMFGQVRQELDFSAQGFDEVRLGQRLARVVSAFYKHIRTDHPDQLMGRISIERQDMVDATECCEHLGPVLQSVDRAGRTLELAHAAV